jgi:rhamnosyl/mannosyltransferase
MTRVVHVGKFYPPVPGGMERVVESLCRATASRVSNRVLAFGSERRTVREEVDGIPVTRLATIGSAGSVPIAPGFARELRRLHADVVVLHEPNPWALLSFALVRPDVPLAIWFHSEVVRPRLQYLLFYHPMVRAVYGRARRIIVSSPALGEQAAALAPYRDRLAVVPFGIDVARWDADDAIASRAAAIRREAGSRPLALFAGRMVPYKGVDVLLRALAGLDGLQLVLAGEGPARAGWVALASSLGLDGRARFVGEVPDAELKALMHACDMLVLPSVTRAEAFGYVQLEAMACAKPVVSTRLPSGVSWVNRDGETGLTVPPGDARGLADALRRLGDDPALGRRLGSAARARVRAEFTLEVMAGRAVEVFESVARGGPA